MVSDVETVLTDLLREVIPESKHPVPDSTLADVFGFLVEVVLDFFFSKSLSISFSVNRIAFQRMRRQQDPLCDLMSQWTDVLLIRSRNPSRRRRRRHRRRRRRRRRRKATRRRRPLWRCRRRPTGAAGCACGSSTSATRATTSPSTTCRPSENFGIRLSLIALA